MELIWKWYTFNALTTEELYAILKLRQEVFVVEQHCAYMDCDNLDKDSYHLAGWDNKQEESELLAYLRVIYPKKPDQLPRIGRIIVHSRVRKTGIGNQLINKAIEHCHTHHRGSQIQISAQVYLIAFYEAIGFQITSDTYEEDNIPHIDMVYSHC